MKRVYFDHVATTPTDRRIIEAMLPYLTEHFGNPQSLHDYGSEPKKALEEARNKTAALINSNSDEIIFTSSGTEANNIAIKGAAMAYKNKGNHIITSKIEHFSVLHTMRTLEKQGFKVSYINPDRDGLINPEDVEKAITNETILISIQHANPEIGTIQPIAEISRIIQPLGIIFHTDAVQTVGNIQVDVNELQVDLLTLSAHQFYGPKGAAALYIRKGTRILPLIDGGIQEGGKRPGTENLPAIVGLGKAAELAKEEMENRIKHITKLREKLINEITKRIEDVYLNGHRNFRLAGNVNLSIEGVEGESVLLYLNIEGIAASSGSACTSRALKASHVLTAIGIDPVLAQGSVLFTLGKDNKEEEVDYLIDRLPKIVEKLRSISPMYKKK